MLASQLIIAAGDSVDELTPAEREILKHRAKVPPKNPKLGVAHSISLVRLYGLGTTDLRSEIVERLNNELRDPNAPLLFGDYLVALSRVAPDCIDAEFDRVINLVGKEQLDPVPFSLGLARLAFLGTAAGKDVARSLVLKMTNMPPYANDERVQQLATLSTCHTLVVA